MTVAFLARMLNQEKEVEIRDFTSRNIIRKVTVKEAAAMTDVNLKDWNFAHGIRIYI